MFLDLSLLVIVRDLMVHLHFYHLLKHGDRCPTAASMNLKRGLGLAKKKANINKAKQKTHIEAHTAFYRCDMY